MLQVADGRLRQLTERDVESGVIPRFRAVVDVQPDAIAVADEHHELTYAELAHQAAAVLTLVRETIATLRPPTVPNGSEAFEAREPVAMLFAHTTEAVVALLAIVASGHPVLVLDARTPGPRLRQLVTTVGARVVITDAVNEVVAHGLGVEIVAPYRTDRDVDTSVLWSDPPEPTSVAAVAFTSGSTGTPKPVANDHRLFVRDAWNSSIVTGCYDASSTIAHTLPIAFHAGLTTTIHGLVVGARMQLFDTRTNGIGALPDVIAEHGCAVMIASPAILRGFVASNPDPAKLASLRSLTIAGEPAFSRDVEAVRPLLPSTCVVRNRYGSSETGLIAEFPMASDDLELPVQLPIGTGVGRTVVDVVDAEGESLPVGETGRLTVTAPTVATGYWGLPEATAAAFYDNGDGTHTYRTSDVGRRRADGTVEIVGRVDHSVKIRGYLVDPGEVDAALSTLPGIREAVTVGHKRADGRAQLVAYVVAPEVDVAGWRGALRAVIPGHMVPDVFVSVPALPRNDRGKIDRGALPEPVEQEHTAQLTTRWEQLVAEQWMAVLDREAQINPDDDFFAIGGDSLAAEALMTRLTDELGINPEVAVTSTLAAHPVLRDFAERLRDPARQASGSLVTLQSKGTRTPVFFMAGGGGMGIAFFPMARRLGADQPAYALQNPVMESRGLPDWSVQAIARRYVKEIRALQPHGPYHLAGHSFGGLVAYEMAQQLKAAGEQVRLALLDSFTPDPDSHPEPEEPQDLRSRVRNSVRLVRASLRDTSGGTDPWRFFLQSQSLGRRYRGLPWDGDTLVVIADSPEKELRSRWDKHLTGSWSSVEISGDHFTMLRDPWVAEVADALRDFFGR